MSNIQANSQPDNTAISCDRPVCDGLASESEEPEPSEIDVDVLWDACVTPWQSRIGLTDRRISQAVSAAAAWNGFRAGEIGVRITDDPTIHQINAKHLSHDYPTDVISFPYGDDDQHEIQGELVASVQTADANAAHAGWETANELLLYVIHGVLHIGGLDDHSTADRAMMRQAEKEVLTQLGIDARPAAEDLGRG